MGEFERFRIIRGGIVDEIGERMDASGDILYGIKEGTGRMLDKQDQMLDKQDQMLDK